MDLKVISRIASRSVKVIVDRDATLDARRKFPSLPDQIVGRFDTSASLYRIFDGEELARIVRTGEITGGTYSTKAERAHGSSWGENITDIITGGNRLRGGRYGDELFLAKLDVMDMPFHHLDPKVSFDPEGDAFQEGVMDLSVCNFGLGCSMKVKLQDVSLFQVDTSGHISRITLAEAKEYVAKKPTKDVDLRQVNSQLYQGSIFGVDVRVWQDKGKWAVLTNDDRKIAFGALTFEDAVELAKMSIKANPSRPVPMPAELLDQRRKHEKHFEVAENPDLARGGFALKPKDRLTVLEGSRSLGIQARATGVVTDVYQAKGDRQVVVKLLIGPKVHVLYATHPNRLKDDPIALIDGRGYRIRVVKR